MRYIWIAGTAMVLLASPAEAGGPGSGGLLGAVTGNAQAKASAKAGATAPM